MVSFLNAEREQGGWRFLLLWVIASNLGFFLGIAIEVLFFKKPTLYLAVPLSAIGQAYVINRHISVYLPWAVGSALFWLLGAYIGYISFAFMPDMPFIDIIRLVWVGAFGGLLAGIPQWIFARDWLPKLGIWWFLVSAVAWALLLPGIVTGFVLMPLITEQKVKMDTRHYQVSGKAL